MLSLKNHYSQPHFEKSNTKKMNWNRIHSTFSQTSRIVCFKWLQKRAFVKKIDNEDASSGGLSDCRTTQNAVCRSDNKEGFREYSNGGTIFK